MGSPPRMRGKVQCVRRFLLAAVGSPPRMRGKVFCSVRRNAAVRITPAYAGKSMKNVTKRVNVKDHPRVCGEKVLPVLSVDRTRGSPPRMRGKEAFDFMSLFRVRITPAYAGKRLQSCARCASR